VSDVLVVGHTNCGAVRAALTLPSSSPLLTNCWIAALRAIRNAHAAELSALSPRDAAARLVELNVMQQVRPEDRPWRRAASVGEV
jgi:carbonic anhydrase